MLKKVYHEFQLVIIKKTTTKTVQPNIVIKIIIFISVKRLSFN